MLLGAATASAVWNGNSCTALRTEHGKIGVFSTLISDLVLLTLMLFGLLRWKSARQTCGLWWFLYTQVFAPCTHSLILTDAIRRAWRGYSWSLLLRSPLQCVYSATHDRPQKFNSVLGFHYLGSEWCVTSFERARVLHSMHPGFGRPP